MGQGVGHDLLGLIGPGAAIAANHLGPRGQHLNPFGHVGTQLKAEGRRGGAFGEEVLCVHAAMVGGMRGLSQGAALQ